MPVSFAPNSSDFVFFVAATVSFNMYSEVQFGNKDGCHQQGSSFNFSIDRILCSEPVSSVHLRASSPQLYRSEEDASLTSASHRRFRSTIPKLQASLSPPLEDLCVYQLPSNFMYNLAPSVPASLQSQQPPSVEEEKGDLEEIKQREDAGSMLAGLSSLLTRSGSILPFLINNAGELSDNLDAFSSSDFV